MDPLREQLDALARRRRRAGSARVAPLGRPAAVPRDLAALVGGRESRIGEQLCWWIERPFAEVCPTHQATQESLCTPRTGRGGRARILPLDPARAFLVDIETGGLTSSAPVFLIGVVALGVWPPRVGQWLARDYPEEEGVLRHLAALAEQRTTWITFNGKSFDEPFLRDRATVHRLTLPPTLVHLDLLFAARRAWGRRLPNCKLGTLEAEILGRPRHGDVPSAQVPEFFHQYYRTGNAAPLKPILEHNQRDLIACAELLARLTQPVQLRMQNGE